MERSRLSQSPQGEKIVEEIVYYVSDGEQLSEPSRAQISVTCTPGTKAVSSVVTIGEGSAQQTVAITVCEPCPIGTYSLGLDTAQCEPCPAGTFANEGQAQCDVCPTGTYNPNPGRSSCLPCPVNSTSNEASVQVTECFCEAGFFGRIYLPEEQAPREQCRECTEADIFGKVVCDSEDQSLPIPRAGFWVDKWATWQTLEQVVRSCIPPEACRGGPEVTADDTWREETCESGESGNGEAYQGRACSECQDKHYRSGGTCKKCPSWGTITVNYVAMGLLLAAPILFRLFMSGTCKEWAYFHVALVFMQFNGLLQKLR